LTFLHSVPLLSRCERAISFHEIKEGERWKNMGFREPRVTFSLPESLN
jgi:hypothetical protein